MAYMFVKHASVFRQSDLAYLAFRVAFRDTLERLTLTSQFDGIPEDGFGYLTEIPFLRSVPPHVQLDLLAETWSRHRVRERFTPTLTDEAVTYAACEYTANLIIERDEDVERFLVLGPSPFSRAITRDLAYRMRELHSSMNSEGEFLVISQFEDVPPEEAKMLKHHFGITAEQVDELFSLLGRWRLSENFQQSLRGLLTDDERHHLEPMYRLNIT